MKQLWTNLDRRGRTVMAGSAALVAVALVLGGLWVARPDYQVLFSDLKPQDTAALVAELERQKIPYRIGGDGNTILTAADAVHATRLKLMGKDIPLHGAAGFELFNNADFGMTEFAQKINYQRALQGEITRTILSLAEVRDARVHLALAEEGLFKRGTAKSKAAITLSLKPGASLRTDQVTGIQRLVAAAVPGIAAQDVTILDQRGVALTRPAADGELETGSGRLDLKKETEQLLARKAGEVLDRALGAGQAIASVDVTLNMDVVRTTSEEVLGGQGRSGQSSGVVVREREVVRETAVAPLDQRPEGRGGNTQREVEYQTGRRVEQVVTQPGAIRRMHVAAVVSQTMDAQQLEQVRALVAAAVGVVPERGDVVVVQSLKVFSAVPQAAPGPAPVAQAPAEQVRHEPASAGSSTLGVILALAAAAVAACAWLFRRKATPAARVLSTADRDVALRQLQLWLQPNDEGTGAFPGTGSMRSAGERP
jgi:flagellar M-ring protein FliF